MFFTCYSGTLNKLLTLFWILVWCCSLLQDPTGLKWYYGWITSLSWPNGNIVFSNQQSSFKSSPGFYVTGNTYSGSHGYSLKLEGLERGINDKASERAIVMHGAEYVNPALVATQGYIGRSLGCPAVPVKMATPIINTIKNGSCLFIYNPSSSYLQQSQYLS